MSKAEEKSYFRVLYFIGIIMVVARHCGLGGFSLFYEWFEAGTFMLGFFLFASGYFFYNNLGKKTIDIVIKKIKKIIIPLYFWHLIYGIVIFILNKIGIISYGQDLNFENIVLNPIYSGHSYVFNKASWFLMPFFMVQIFSIIFLPLLKKKWGSYFVFVLYLILGFIGVQLSMAGYNTKWYLVLTRFLYFLPFFGLGLLYKDKLEKHDNLKNIWYFSIVMFLQLCLVYYKGGLEVYIPSWCLNFKDFVCPFLFGFFGIAFWLRISKILVPIFKDSKIVNMISKNTFSIMIHHMFGFFILNLLWYFLAKNFNFIDGFNFNKFYTSPDYLYLPKKLFQFATLYVVFGIGFSLIVSYFESKIKYKLPNLTKNKKAKER